MAKVHERILDWQALFIAQGDRIRETVVIGSQRKVRTQYTVAPKAPRSALVPLHPLLRRACLGTTASLRPLHPFVMRNFFLKDNGTSTSVVP